MANLKIEEFQRLDLRIGRITSAERVEGTTKLMALEVDIGEKRKLVAGIADRYSPEDVVGRLVVVLANLEPKRIRGIDSQGMILAAVVGESAFLVAPDSQVPVGSRVL